MYVGGLKHDLLSVGQMCDIGYNISFYAKGCDIWRNGLKEITGRWVRNLGNVYVLDNIQGEKCYVG